MILQSNVQLSKPLKFKHNEIVKNMYRQKISIVLIFTFFFFAVLTLIFSGLSFAKAISLQNDVSILFFQELQSKEIFSAVISSTSFILQSAILPLLPFLIFSSIGFLSVLYFRPDVKYLLAALTAVLIASIMVKFSPVIAIICLGYFPSVILLKNMEEKKTAFKTSSSFISSCLRWQNIFVAIAVFLGIFLMPNFDSIAQQGMLSSIRGLLPQDLQAAQTEAIKTLVEQNIDNAKTILNSEYIKTGASQQCEDFNNNVQSALDNYKTQMVAQMENATAQVDISQLPQIGFLSVFAKTIPFTSAIAIFFLLELLKPLSAALAGIFYKFAKEKT